MGLIALGGLAVVGLAVWELRGHLGRRKDALRNGWGAPRREPRLGDLGVEPPAEGPRLTPGIPEAPDSPSESPAEVDAPPPAPEAGAAAPAEAPVAEVTEPLILVLHVHARGDWFQGPEIARVAHDLDLLEDEMGLLALRDHPEGPALLRVASMAAPGRLPLERPQGFTCPGLTLFTQIPGPKPGAALYAEMVTLAQRLAESLGGEVRDETHSTLTRQTMDHTRHRILDFERRLRIARGRS